MAFDSPGLLTTVETLVDGVSTVTTSYIGVPLTVGDRISAYLFLVPLAVDDKRIGGNVMAQVRVRVVFVYRTDGDVRASELAIAAAYDEFLRDYYAARKVSGSVFGHSELDASIASGAEYEAFAGQEFRRLPIDVVISQHDTFGVV